MAVNLLVNILNGAHSAVLDTLDHGPAIEFCGSPAGLPTGRQIGHILFVDVGFGVGLCFPMAHHLFCVVGGDIQINGQVRAGEPKLIILK